MTFAKAIKPRKTPVQERSKFTVEIIYEAAVQVFTENGYAGATTDLIAERAGVSIGTLYQYFPNKKAILIGIWNRGMEDADRKRDLFLNSCKWEGGLDPDKIKSILKTVLEIHKESIKPHLFFEEIAQPAFIKERLLEKESINIAMFTAILEHSTNLRTHRLDIAARMMYEVMERLIHRYLTHFQHELTEDEFITEASDMISRYLFANDKA
ncbi:MAG: TetR/AcrR family transcriptional regulator [Desulfobacteraceae bacterium]|nr:MAG: TetR/AcrR family transcriptional regulator [Desulfobacteraceae bacterium]